MSSNVKATGPAVLMPRSTGALYGKDSSTPLPLLTGWRKYAAIITIIACSILAGGIALGIGMSPAVFAVISSEGVAGLTLACTLFTLALSFLVRYIINRHNEKKAALAAASVKKNAAPAIKSSESRQNEIVRAPSAFKPNPVPQSPAKTPVTKASLPTVQKSPPSTPKSGKSDPAQRLIFDSPKKPSSASKAPPATPPRPPALPAVVSKSSGAKAAPSTLVKGPASAGSKATPPAAARTSNSSPAKKPTKLADTVSPTKTKVTTVQPGVYRIGKKQYKDKIRSTSEFLLKVADDERMNSLERADALFELGKLSLLDEDNENAFQYFERAANLESPDAMHQLGLRHFLGEGTDVSITKAIKWFEKAWRRGCDKAGMKLYDIYSEGLGVEKDEEKADEYKGALTTSP